MNIINSNDSIDELLKEKEATIRKENYVDSGAELIENIEDKTTFLDFIKARDYGYTILVSFTAIVNKELHVTCNGCTVICKAEEFNEQKDLTYGLAKAYEAVIKEIDFDNKIVYVSCKDAWKKSKRRHINVDKSLNQKISDALKNGESVIYPAKIISVQSKAQDNGNFYSFAIVSILDTNVKGFIYAKDYSQCWIQDLRRVAKKGDWIDVEIVSKRNSKNEPYYWNCSRLNITENPWTKQNIEERFRKGDYLLVKCVSKDPNGKCWWGTCDDVKGIQVISDYESGIEITIGQYYRCWVKKVDSSCKIFRVKVLAKAENIINDNLISFIKEEND